MSWLLFLDESGHDHNNLPYEIHGGIALHASRLWEFIQAIRTLEQSKFGAFLHDYGTEIKGSKLLAKDRFKWERQGPKMGPQELRKHALNFLNSSAQGRVPHRDEFTAYGQACISFAEEVCTRLKAFDAMLFAAIIPPIERPKVPRNDVPRKDIVFLLERYFYFLEEKKEMGLLVMDQTEKNNDRQLISRMERYFVETIKGTRRAQRVVPSPLFVESDMAYGVQIADLCIYCLNYGYRRDPRMSSPVRPEIQDFANLLEPVIWHGRVEQNGKHFHSHGVVFVPDPYTARDVQK